MTITSRYDTHLRDLARIATRPTIDMIFDPRDEAPMPTNLPDDFCENDPGPLLPALQASDKVRVLDSSGAIMCVATFSWVSKQKGLSRTDTHEFQVQYV